MLCNLGIEGRSSKEPWQDAQRARAAHRRRGRRASDGPTRPGPGRRGRRHVKAGTDLKATRGKGTRETQPLTCATTTERNGIPVGRSAIGGSGRRSARRALRHVEVAAFLPREHCATGPGRARCSRCPQAPAPRSDHVRRSSTSPDAAHPIHRATDEPQPAHPPAGRAPTTTPSPDPRPQGPWQAPDHPRRRAASVRSTPRARP
jgi:hypothetical protein